jgi:hypothetical protein
MIASTNAPAGKVTGEGRASGAVRESGSLKTFAKWSGGSRGALQCSIGPDSLPDPRAWTASPIRAGVPGSLIRRDASLAYLAPPRNRFLVAGYGWSVTVKARKSRTRRMLPYFSVSRSESTAASTNGPPKSGHRA